MAGTRVINDLTTIKLTISDTTYIIRAEEVKESDKQSNEKIFTSDSHDAQEISFGQCEYSIDLSGLLPRFKKMFNRLRHRQRVGWDLCTLRIYGYEQNTPVLQSVYNGVYVEDIDRSNSKPFDVKLGALSKTYINSKNELI